MKNGNWPINEEMAAQDTPLVDSLDQKLITAFPGRVVRKDLVQKLKVGFSIPVFVLEYLLGKYCSHSTNEEEITKGLAIFSLMLPSCPDFGKPFFFNL